MTDFAITLVPLGLRGGAALLSIGAYAMNASSLTSERRFAQNVQPQDNTPGLHREPAILSTWKRDIASTAAGAVLLENPLPLRAAVENFHAWVALYPEPHRFWSTHPHLDWPLYADVCRALMVAQQFSFADVRDATTLLIGKEVRSRGAREVVIGRLMAGDPAQVCAATARLIDETRIKLCCATTTTTTTTTTTSLSDTGTKTAARLSTAMKLQTLIGLLLIISSGAAFTSRPAVQAFIGFLGVVCIVLVAMK